MGITTLFLLVLLFVACGSDDDTNEPLVSESLAFTDGYERLQIGATANPTSSQFVLYIDNFKLLVE